METAINASAKKKNVAATVAVSSIITGVGMAVPDRIVKNDYFAKYLDTTDAWIQERTGIAERRWADPGTTTCDLAEVAARKALESAGLDSKDIDGIIVATTTPDVIFPSTACMLQQRIKCPSSMAFDVNAVCSGFIYALSTADALLATGNYHNILVIGADIYSRIINPQDRSTCILFGDGAGAIILSRVTSGGVTNGNGLRAKRELVTGSASELRGIYGSELRADGAAAEILYCNGVTASEMATASTELVKNYIVMNGREVFKLAVRSLVEISESLTLQCGLTIDDIDYFVSHQANKRILSAMAKQLAVDESKVLCNVDRYGNTSAASVPILLAEAVESGRIKRGDLLLLSAFGGGATWGAVLLRW